MHILIFTILALLQLPSAAQVGTAPIPGKPVVVLHSYPPGDWFHGINQGIAKRLRQAGHQNEIIPIVFHAEFWTNQNPSAQSKERATVLESIRAKNASALIICDDEAVDFFGPYLADFGIPVVATGLNRPANEIPWIKPSTRQYMAGVQEFYPMTKTIETLKVIKPKAKEIAVFTSMSMTSLLIADQVSREMSTSLGASGIELKQMFKLKMWEDWKREMAQVSKSVDAILVLVPYDVRDTNNVEVPVSQMAGWIQKNISIPTIGIVTAHVKMGALFSWSVSPFALGRRTGELASQILEGAKPETLGFVPFEEHQLEMNRSAVRRFGYSIPKSLSSTAIFYEGIDLPYGR